MWEKVKALKGETKAFLILLVLLVCSLFYGWYLPDEKLPTKTPIALPAVSSVNSVPKVEVPVPKLKVYKKPDIGKKVALPLAVITDDNKQVTAVVDVPPSRGGTEVISVTDIETGDTVIHAREKELPLLAFETMKRIGVGYGVGTSGMEAKAFGEFTFARIGAFYLSAYAEINAGAVRAPEAKVLATVDYRTQ